jgi:hypothetical protein
MIRLAIIVSLLFSSLSFGQEGSSPLRIVSEDTTPYVGRVQLDGFTVRLLVLKHCFERMADNDARLAIEAANLAAEQGLTIQNVGEHYINRDGPADRRRAYSRMDLDKLRDFIVEQMKIKAQDGDTFVVMTIGHGQPGGSLQTLGQRSEVLNAIASAAVKTDQKTLWWQLSCYASSALPSVQNLPSEQQEKICIVASSDSRTPSPAGIEGKIMGQVFHALAKKDRDIDPDGDETVTVKELSDFLNKVKAGRGNLVYARSKSDPIFGLSSIAQRIPIKDRNNPQGNYPKNYIPLPKRS